MHRCGDDPNQDRPDCPSCSRACVCVCVCVICARVLCIGFEHICIDMFQSRMGGWGRRCGGAARPVRAHVRTAPAGEEGCRQDWHAAHVIWDRTGHPSPHLQISIKSNAYENILNHHMSKRDKQNMFVVWSPGNMCCGLSWCQRQYPASGVAEAFSAKRPAFGHSMTWW